MSDENITENVQSEAQNDVQDDIQIEAENQTEAKSQYQKADFEGNPYYAAWSKLLPTIYDDDELRPQAYEPDQEKNRLESDDKWGAFLSIFYGKTAEEVALQLERKLDDYEKENNFLQDQIHHLQEGIITCASKMIVSSDPATRAGAAMYATNDQLDKLVGDSDPAVRASVVKQCRDKDLDLLVNDQEPIVRRAVAIIGRDQDLDILVHDNDYSVIRKVIKHQRSQDLEYLRNSNDVEIRKLVVENGRGEDLDFLVGDADPRIRTAVAEQGRDKDLDCLASDNDSSVRLAVLAHNRKQDLDLLVDDPNEEVRIVVAQHGRKKDRKVFKYDPSIDVRMTYAFATDDPDIISDFVRGDQTADFFKKSVHSPGEKKHVSDIAFTLTQTLCQLHDYGDLEYLLTLTSKTSTQIPFTMIEYIAEFEKNEKRAKKLMDLLLNSKKKLVKETVQKYFDSKR